MKISKIAITTGLLITTVSFAEITTFTVCDRNKNEYVLIGKDMRKIAGSCLNYQIKSKACTFTSYHDYPDLYQCRLTITPKDYPTFYLGYIVYDINQNKISVREDVCVEIDRMPIKTGENTFEIIDCPNKLATK